MAGVEKIEGVGGSYVEKLSAAGLKTTDALLGEGSTPAGRKGSPRRRGLAKS